MPMNYLVKQREEKQDNSTSKGVDSNYYEFICELTIHLTNCLPWIFNSMESSCLFFEIFPKTPWLQILNLLSHFCRQLIDVISYSY